MRALRANQQPLKYALQVGVIPVFDTDESGNIKYQSYMDDEGNEIPILDKDGNKIPLFTGEYETAFGEVVSFLGSIAMSGGEAQAVEYGLSVEKFSAIAITASNAIPLTEGSLIWHKSEPRYKDFDGTVEIDGKTISGRFVEKTSADYIVVKKNASKNFDKYILEAVNK